MKKLLRLAVLVFIIIVSTIFLYYKKCSSVNKAQKNGLKENSSKDSGQLVNTRPYSIFCIIITQQQNFDTRVKAIYETWARDCDNFAFIAKTNSSINSSGDYLNYLLDPPGLEFESYDYLTDKVFLSFMHFYKEHRVKFDWYLKADDDTFIFMDNLRTFLSDKNPYMPVTYGYNFKMNDSVEYHSGGAGRLFLMV